MLPEPNQMLSHYRLIEKLGEGGMGVVWKALDTTLGREVAIKILPEELAKHPERQERFEREAKVLASLQHPNIAVLHGLHHEGDVSFLVMEFVAGEDLSKRIAGQALPMNEALKICAQVASAMQRAHEQGIVHRDLKPANIMLTASGEVKVLDFGLAKVLDPHASTDADETSAPTVTSGGTVAGALLGTAAYMSPEQARGTPTDRRTDIWSFGCVLYECLTGVSQFRGKTVSDSIGAVLHTSPDWDALPPNLPATVGWVLRRCLMKDREHRLHDIADARIEIDDALRGPTPEAPAPTPGVGGLGAWRLAAGLLGMALLVVLGLWMSRPAPPPRTVTFHRLTDFVGLEEFPAISPDGRTVAFSAEVDGHRQIWVRLLAGGAPLRITEDPEDHQFPRWTPDSASLVYYTPAAGGRRQGAIWQVAALGGTPRRLFDSVSDADLSPDGRHVVFFRLAEDGVDLVKAARDGSGEARLAAVPGQDGMHSFPRWSPDGRWIAFRADGNTVAFSSRLMVVPAEGGEPRLFWQDQYYNSGFSWLPDASGVVSSSARGNLMAYLPTYNLWAIDLDGGEPRQLTFGEASYLYPDINADGMLVASRRRMDLDLWRFPVDGTPKENVRRAARVTRQTGHVATPSPSPGDREIAFLSDSGGKGNVWVAPLDGGPARQLTSEQHPGVLVGLPVWSPDGKHITFFYQDAREPERDGNWLMNPDGSNRRFLADGGWSCWSWDSKWLYYGALREDNVQHIEKIPVDGGEPVTVRTDWAMAPAIHPDGETLFYLTMVERRLQIRKARPEDGPSELLLELPASSIQSLEGQILMQPTISPDGKQLAIFLADTGGTNLWTISVDDGTLRQLTDFGERATFITRRVSWSSDGRSLFAAVGFAEEDVVLLEGLLR